MSFSDLCKDEYLLSELRDYIKESLSDKEVVDISYKDDKIVCYICDLGFMLDPSNSMEENKNRLLLFANLYSEQLYMYAQNKIQNLDLSGQN